MERLLQRSRRKMRAVVPVSRNAADEADQIAGPQPGSLRHAASARHANQDFTAGDQGCACRAQVVDAADAAVLDFQVDLHPEMLLEVFGLACGGRSAPVRAAQGGIEELRYASGGVAAAVHTQMIMHLR